MTDQEIGAATRKAGRGLFYALCTPVIAMHAIGVPLALMYSVLEFFGVF